MAQPILTSNLMSLSEIVKRVDAQGKEIPVANVLEKTNDFLPDVKFQEGNLINGDQFSVQTSKADVHWLHENVGIPSSHSTTALMTENCGKLGACSDIPSDLLEINAFDAGWRFREEKIIMESIAEKATQHFFYGSKKANPESFDGFGARYNSISKGQNSKNVIDCGGRTADGELTSIWLVGWGDMVHGLYPKGTKAGIQVNDEGVVWMDDGTGRNTQMKVNRTTYKWNLGLSVRDWRCVVRLANIPVQALRDGRGIGSGDVKVDKNLLMIMTEALYKIPANQRKGLRIYMNNDVFAGLNVIAQRSQSNVIKFMDASKEFGENGSWTSFMGVPLRQVDELHNKEEEVK